MNTNLKAVEEEKCNSKRKDGKGTEQKRVYIYTKFLDGQKKKKKKKYKVYVRQSHQEKVRYLVDNVKPVIRDNMDYFIF